MRRTTNRWSTTPAAEEDQDLADWLSGRVETIAAGRSAPGYGDEYPEDFVAGTAALDTVEEAAPVVDLLRLGDDFEPTVAQRASIEADNGAHVDTGIAVDVTVDVASVDTPPGFGGSGFAASAPVSGTADEAPATLSVEPHAGSTTPKRPADRPTKRQLAAACEGAGRGGNGGLAAVATSDRRP